MATSQAEPTSFAVSRDLGSSSETSGTTYAKGFLISIAKNSTPVDKLNNMQDYDLCALAAVSEFTLTEQKSEGALAELITSWDLGVELRTTREVPGMKEMKPLYSNTRQLPDISVYNKDHKWMTNIEVHSSAFGNTVRKAITGGIDMLRFLRNSHNLNEVTVFAFPKIGTKSTVVKITVQFQHLNFFYFLEPIRLSNAESSFAACLTSCPGYDLPKHIQRFLIKLTEVEKLQMIPRRHLQGCEADIKQIPSTSSITLTTNTHCYKLFEELAPVDRCTMAFRDSPTSHRIQCQTTRCGLLRVNIVHYKKVPYDPLTVDEAKRCLIGLVELIKEALDELHEDDFAHCDIRLPNICFSRQYKAVLIDLERISPPGESFEGPSCMYEVPVACVSSMDVDFVAFGWLVVDVLLRASSSHFSRHQASLTNYHQRKYTELPVPLKQSTFLSNLILRGTYSSIADDPSLLPLLIDSKDSVEDVLNNRI